MFALSSREGFSNLYSILPNAKMQSWKAKIKQEWNLFFLPETPRDFIYLFISLAKTFPEQTTAERKLMWMSSCENVSSAEEENILSYEQGMLHVLLLPKHKNLQALLASEELENQ